MNASPTTASPRLAGLSRQNIALIVFVMIGAVIGMIAAYLFTSMTFRWLLAIALIIAVLTGLVATYAYYIL